MRKHTWQVRDDGLDSCTVCGGGEGSLPAECPGARMTADEQDAVYAGQLEYVRGRWWAPKVKVEGLRALLMEVLEVAESSDRILDQEEGLLDRIRAVVEKKP